MEKFQALHDVLKKHFVSRAVGNERIFFGHDDGVQSRQTTFMENTFTENDVNGEAYE